MTSEIPNFKEFREIEQVSIDEYLDDDLPLSTNLMNLIKESVALPYPDIQLPILASYVMIPSAMATVVPVLVLQGNQGSGKSVLNTLFAGLHNVSILSAVTTFAAIRNYVNQARWAIPGAMEGERNYCFILDNITRDNLLDEQLYVLFLNGYNRKTDKICISKGSGENIVFGIFGTKIISTIHPFYVEAKFAELNRRCLVIKCKTFELMSPNEKIGHENFDVNNRLELDNVDLLPLHWKYTEFWNNPLRLRDYAAIKRNISKRQKNFTIPRILTSSIWTISGDLLTTGIITGIWGSFESAIEAIAKYWELRMKENEILGGGINEVLKTFINEEKKIIAESNKVLGFNALPQEINPEKLKKHLLWASTQGMLEVIVTPSITASTMADLGWKLGRGKTGNICWIPTT